MEIIEIRIANLDKLIGPPEKRGRIADFARAHGLDPSYLSQLLNKNRNFGEKSARKMERSIGLPEFTLDKIMTDDSSIELARQIAGNAGEKASMLLELFLKATPELQAIALHLLKLESNNSSEEPAKEADK